MVSSEGNQVGGESYAAAAKEQFLVKETNDSTPNNQVAYNDDMSNASHSNDHLPSASKRRHNFKKPDYLAVVIDLSTQLIVTLCNFTVQGSTDTGKDKHLQKLLDVLITLPKSKSPADLVLCYLLQLICFMVQPDCGKAVRFSKKDLYRLYASTDKDKRLHAELNLVGIMSRTDFQDGSLTDAAASTRTSREASFDISPGQLTSDLSSKHNEVYRLADKSCRLLVLPSKELGVVKKSSSLELGAKIFFLTRNGTEKQLPGGFTQISLRSTSKAVMEGKSDAAASSICNQQRAESQCGRSSLVCCDDSVLEIMRLENQLHFQRENGCIRALEIEKCKKSLSHKIPFFELTESCDCISDQQTATSHGLPTISLERLKEAELPSTSSCRNDCLDTSTSDIAVRTPSTSAGGVASGCTLSAAQESDLEPESSSATTVLSETSVQCADQADKNVSSYEFVRYALIIAIQAIVSFFHRLWAVSPFRRQFAETSEVQVAVAELETWTDSQDKEVQNLSCVQPVSESLLECENAVVEEHEQEISKKLDYPLETDGKKSYHGRIDPWLYDAWNWLRSMCRQARFVSAFILQLSSIVRQGLTLLGWFITSAFSKTSRVSGACELLRLASFHAWPHLGKLSALSFSSAGFFFTGNVDAVSCFSCGFTARGWTAVTHPLAAHRERCRDRCQLIGECQGSGNIPLSKTTQPAAVSRERNEHTGRHPMGAAASAASRPPNSEPSVQSPEMSKTASSDAYSLVHSLLAATGATPGKHAQSINQGGYGSCDLAATGSVGSSQDEERIKWESYRLSTFANVWTFGHIVEPGDLARNGFFYKGPGDRVQCAFCQGVLRNWEPGDRADEQHAQHFTYCRFVQGHEVGNKPYPFSPLVAKQVGVANGVADAAGDSTRADDFGIVRALPKNPDFAVEARRLSTFATWMTSAHHLPSPDALAKAGFFFLGNEDAVKCFFCDCIVADWKSNCDPWVWHVRSSPACQFLIQVKGSQFVQRHQVHDALPSSVGAQKTSFAVDPREIRARMDSPKVRILLQMDYPLDLVKEVVQKRLATVGRDHEGPEELLAEVFATHDEKQRTAAAAQAATARQGADDPLDIVSLPTDDGSSSQLSAAGGSSCPALPVAMAASAPMMTGGASGNSLPALQPLASLSARALPPQQEPVRSVAPEEENRQLKMQLTCKICMDSVVGIVFLPCGHLVCCAECSPALTTCPICRVSIRGTVRTTF